MPDSRFHHTGSAHMNRFLAPAASGLAAMAILFGAAACSDKSPDATQASLATQAPAKSATTSAARPVGTAQPSATAPQAQPTAPSVTVQATARVGGDLSVADVVKLADPSIVRIQTTAGVGTGFIITEDGYLITNNHVVQGRNGRAQDTVQVLLSDGTNLTGKVVGADARADIAVVKLDRPEPFKARELGIPEGTRGVLLAAADSVSVGSPAEKGGLRSGDVIITIDGVAIHTESDLAVQMIREEPNKKVDVEIFRGGKKQTLQVTLGTPVN